MLQSIIDSFWFLLIYLILLLFCIIYGKIFRINYEKKQKWANSGAEAAIIGIFSLIISFTFLQSGNSHRERYNYIHQEANAATLLYRNSKQLPDSFVQKTKMFVLPILEKQLKYKSINNHIADSALMKITRACESYSLIINSYQDKNPAMAPVILKISANVDQFQANLCRHAYSYEERTPSFIIYLLVITSLLIGFLIGFMTVSKEVINYLAPLIYFVTVSLTMMVILDLNNPFSGAIKPDYHDLKITYDYIKKF